jgi:hypothetical protein
VWPTIKKKKKKKKSLKAKISENCRKFRFCPYNTIYNTICNIDIKKGDTPLPHPAHSSLRKGKGKGKGKGERWKSAIFALVIIRLFSFGGFPITARHDLLLLL